MSNIFLSMIYGAALLVTVLYNTPLTLVIVILASFALTYKHYRDIYDPVIDRTYLILGITSIATSIMDISTLNVLVYMLVVTGDNNQLATNIDPIVIHFIYITWMMMIAPYYAAYVIKWIVNKLSVRYA